MDVLKSRGQTYENSFGTRMRHHAQKKREEQARLEAEEKARVEEAERLRKEREVLEGSEATESDELYATYPEFAMFLESMKRERGELQVHGRLCCGVVLTHRILCRPRQRPLVEVEVVMPIYSLVSLTYCFVWLFRGCAHAQNIGAKAAAKSRNVKKERSDANLETASASSSPHSSAQGVPPVSDDVKRSHSSLSQFESVHKSTACLVPAIPRLF